MTNSASHFNRSKNTKKGTNRISASRLQHIGQSSASKRAISSRARRAHQSPTSIAPAPHPNTSRSRSLPRAPSVPRLQKPSDKSAMQRYGVQ
jgi:hypothetical protein